MRASLTRLSDFAYCLGRASKIKIGGSARPRKQFAYVLVYDAITRIFKREGRIQKFPMTGKVIEEIESWAHLEGAEGRPTGVAVVVAKGSKWRSGKITCDNPQYGLGEIEPVRLEHIVGYYRETFRQIWAGPAASEKTKRGK
jgi:hypothetical protein